MINFTSANATLMLNSQLSSYAFVQSANGLIGYGEMSNRQKTPAEYIGERVLRPIIDKAWSSVSIISTLFQTIGWPLKAVVNCLPSLPSLLPTAYAEEIPHADTALVPTTTTSKALVLPSKVEEYIARLAPDDKLALLRDADLRSNWRDIVNTSSHLERFLIEQFDWHYGKQKTDFIQSCTVLANAEFALLDNLNGLRNISDVGKNPSRFWLLNTQELVLRIPENANESWSFRERTENSAIPMIGYPQADVDCSSDPVEQQALEQLKQHRPSELGPFNSLTELPFEQFRQFLSAQAISDLKNIASKIHEMIPYNLSQIELRAIETIRNKSIEIQGRLITTLSNICKRHREIVKEFSRSYILINNSNCTEWNISRIDSGWCSFSNKPSDTSFSFSIQRGRRQDSTSTAKPESQPTSATCGLVPVTLIILGAFTVVCGKHRFMPPVPPSNTPPQSQSDTGARSVTSDQTEPVPPSGDSPDQSTLHAQSGVSD